MHFFLVLAVIHPIQGYLSNVGAPKEFAHVNNCAQLFDFLEPPKNL